MCADATRNKTEWVKLKDKRDTIFTAHSPSLLKTLIEHSYRNPEVWYRVVNCPQPNGGLLSFWGLQSNKIMSPLRAWTITVNECFMASLRDNVIDVFIAFTCWTTRFLSEKNSLLLRCHDCWQADILLSRHTFQMWILLPSVFCC